MSELIKHECGVAQVRLKKPLEYFSEKYGTPLYGFYKLFLLMEKQRNRGQDGAGVASVNSTCCRASPTCFANGASRAMPWTGFLKTRSSNIRSCSENGDILPDYVPSIKAKFDFWR